MTKKKPARFNPPFFYKLLFFGLIVIAAAWFSQTHYPRSVIEALLPYWMLAAIVAGVFYTSFLTIPFSLIALYILSEYIDPVPLALLGGFGAMIGDLVILRFFKSVYGFISGELKTEIQSDWLRQFKKVLKSWHLNFFAVVIGAVIIASPFPDEAGLALIGLSNISYTRLMVLVFLLNTIGILLIIVPAYLFL